ncbi:MAG: UPF0149 family protein [Halioglobus sp.]
MYDDMSDDVGVFGFDEFADHLLDQGVLTSPAQLHGCLTGLLSAGAPQDPEYGLDAVQQTLNVDLHGELASRIMQLFLVTAAALQDDEFTFHPLLPDDAEEIVVRTAALASWCEGFLAGFAYRIAGEDMSSGALSQEASEVLRDIAAMAQAEADEGESEDDAENSFSELVEYLRVAVVNVFMDSSAALLDRKHSAEHGHPPH